MIDQTANQVSHHAARWAMIAMRTGAAGTATGDEEGGPTGICPPSSCTAREDRDGATAPRSIRGVLALGNRVRIYLLQGVGTIREGPEWVVADEDLFDFGCGTPSWGDGIAE